MAKENRNLSNLVILTAFGDANECIEEARLSVDEYYEESSKLIDSSDYRRVKKIKNINGKIYNDDGQLVQSFQNRYNDAGVLTHNRIVHDDGSITEQTI
jgi:hypothetical protein